MGVFNKGRDSINRDKILAGILSNCICHIVENPSSHDIPSIINSFFIKLDFEDKENMIYTKNYLIDNKIKDKSTVEENIEILNDKNDSQYQVIKQEFEDDFLKAKGSEANDFPKKIFRCKIIFKWYN